MKNNVLNLDESLKQRTYSHSWPHPHTGVHKISAQREQAGSEQSLLFIHFVPHPRGLGVHFCNVLLLAEKE